MFQTTNQISIHIYLQFTIAYPSQFVPVTDCTATRNNLAGPQAGAPHFHLICLLHLIQWFCLMDLLPLLNG
jgi:hypothetical protein